MEFELSNGFVTLADKEDLGLLESYKWHKNSVGYVVRFDNRKPILFHRVILKAKEKEVVDHINGNTLDNRKSNLRICTHSQNLMNQKPQKGRSSKYKGVCFVKRLGKYTAKIKKEGKDYFLGNFKNEKEAVLAYNKKAVELFGEYCRLNEID